MTCLNFTFRRSILKSSCVMGVMSLPKTLIFGFLVFLFHGFPKIGLPRICVLRRDLFDEMAYPVTHFDHARSVGVQYVQFSCSATCCMDSGPSFVSSWMFW